MLGFSKFMLATGAAAAVTTGAMIPRPASADTTSTLLTAAAAIGAIVLYSNYQHKQAAANAIVGYTPNGGTVYGNGRVVMPDGQTYYPNSNGQYNYGGGYNQNTYGNGAAVQNDYPGNGNYNGNYNGSYNGNYNGNAAYANARQYNGRPTGQYDGRSGGQYANVAHANGRTDGRDHHGH
jgi:hypothetical protein